MHSHWTSGVQIISYSHRLKHKKNVHQQQESLNRNCWVWWIKKKTQLQQSTLFSDGDEVPRGLNKTHKGKHLLIPAKVLYSGQVPFGQEDYLFQYSVRSVNKEHKTLAIQYDERCISNYSDAFQDFPLHDENEETINSYQIKH